MYGDFKQHLQQELESIKEAGLYKTERVICSPQRSAIGCCHSIVISSKSLARVKPWLQVQSTIATPRL